MACSGHFLPSLQNDPKGGRAGPGPFVKVSVQEETDMKTTRVTTTVLASLAAIALTGSFTMAQTHVMQNVSATIWGPAPPMLPPGAQIAVLSGNPMQATAY